MSSFFEWIGGAAVESICVLVLCAVFLRLWSMFLPFPKRVAVPAMHAGVIFHNDRPVKVVKAGTHWVLPSQSLMVCDLRSRPFQIQAQALRTADDLWVQVSLQGEYRVQDAALYLSINKDPFSSVFLEMKQALQMAAQENTAEAIEDGSALLSERVKELAIARASELGVELTRLGVAEVLAPKLRYAE